MSYYQLDGASGVFAAPEVQVHESPKTWRWLIASFFVVLTLSISTVIVKVLAGVEQAAIDLPKVAAAVTQQSPEQQPAAVAALPETTVPSMLQTELEAWTASRQSSWSFYVQSLDTKDTLATVNETKQFQMASIYKLFLVKPLAKKLPVEAWETNKVTDRTYKACVQAMLSVSDNPCAEAIAGAIGWNPLHKQAQADGYKATVLNSTEKFYSTASDTGLLLDRLYHGDGYEAKVKSVALDALSKRKGTEAMRRACTDCTVYNKTGDLGGYKHDAALVEKNGKAYVVVIFSSGASWAEATEAAKIINKYL